MVLSLPLADVCTSTWLSLINILQRQLMRQWLLSVTLGSYDSVEGICKQELVYRGRP